MRQRRMSLSSRESRIRTFERPKQPWGSNFLMKSEPRIVFTMAGHSLLSRWTTRFGNCCVWKTWCVTGRHTGDSTMGCGHQSSQKIKCGPRGGIFIGYRCWRTITERGNVCVLIWLQDQQDKKGKFLKSSGKILVNDQ